MSASAVAAPLEELLDGAGADDPVFPEALIAALERHGHLAANAKTGDRPPAADELALRRRHSGVRPGHRRQPGDHRTA